MPLTAVIDFETTGLSPVCGDRATEVAIVLLESGQVVDRFQSLMNAGVRIPAFITQLTGISNSMIASTLLLSRRLYPQVPNHKLGSLVDYHRLPRTGQAHRALADAEMAAELLSQIQRDLHFRHGFASADHALLLALQRCAKPAVAALLARHAAARTDRR